ncbi:MAG: hypothetical protein KDE51_17065, partial [Anaerolineales bacterium]|nr:hypothetical protein [Anaerolineales bacterium]
MITGKNSLRSRLGRLGRRGNKNAVNDNPEQDGLISTQEIQTKYSQLSEAQQREISTLIAAHLNEAARPEPNLTHRVIGRLVFGFDGPDGQAKPLHHMPL